MVTLVRTGLRAALIAVAALGWWTSASAQLTPAGATIANRATVSYSVNGQSQAAIESSPLGNTTPGNGAGANTEFLVDNRVDFTVTELSGNATVTTPGAANAALAFRVLNTGNAPQGYALSFLEEVGGALFTGTDNVNFGNLVIRVDEDPSGTNGTGNGTYDGTETATAINTLNAGQDIVVFVVSPTVPALANGTFANVRLQGQAAVPATNGGTIQAQSSGVNNATTIEVIFADDSPTGGDGIESDLDQFAIQSAALTVTKTQTVVDDGFGSLSPRAIPGAYVEYSIVVANTSTTTAATAIGITDPLPVNTTFRAAPTGAYASGAADVAITGGAVATCVAETPTDTNGDSCLRNASNQLVVGSAAIGNVAANGGTVTVRFQVRIN